MASSTSSYPLVLLLLLAATAFRRSSSHRGVRLRRQRDHRDVIADGVRDAGALRGDGSFEVYFPRPCEFLLAGTWLVRYEPRVRGSVAAGSLMALDGISVKVLFLWLGVGEVDRAGDTLSFYVGPVATSFPLDDFAESPRCRGYDDGGAGDDDDFFPAAAAASS
ncbi:unnamed protein product [Miscanthus lutarioriparius]|uniref:Uncharacterized protein n=1 Tax=Miscanthus lutarioriparius TaxID=422564 RepID=A0A811SGT7_9POAL|nr:unnamed protein product [Miscanthus lutarioriparius]